MFARSVIRRNALPLLACLVAGGAGCGAQQFLRMERLEAGPRLDFFLGGGGNSLALRHSGVAFLVDPKLRPASRRMRQVLEDELRRQVRRVLVTHSHGDHASGLGLYDGAVVLAHPATRARLTDEGFSAAWVDVSSEVRLVLGGEPVRVLYLGVGHTDGDLVALFEQRRLLVAGDLVLEKNEPVIDERAGGDLLALAGTLDRLLELDFERVLPGHGQPVDRARVERLRAYLAAVQAAVEAARDRGLDEDAVAREVRVDGFDDLEPVPFLTNRGKTLRLMFRALKQRGERE
ncbi:MAG: MBL fold metallo-hydrolase [Myxococcota bacterium]|jgi:glyoxylase-like metal-dependent hydrolase (beta-lactamase superfamily II)